MKQRMEKFYALVPNVAIASGALGWMFMNTSLVMGF